MRICSPQLGISPKSILGGEIYDREILTELAQLGNNIEIVLPFGKQHNNIQNWKISYLPIPFIIPPHLFNVFVFPYLLYIYWRRPFDILRVHSPVFVGVAGIVFKYLFPSVKLIVHYHFLGEGGMSEKLINPIITNYADAVICDSKYTANKINQLYSQSKGKVLTIYNGVDRNLSKKKKSKKLQNRYHITKETTTLFFMGLFIPRKNPLYLLDVVAILIRNKEDVRLLLCGSGPQRETIDREIQKRKLQKYVYIVNPVFGKEKNDLLNTADIFVHPSLEEGFSLSVIEAMAVGLPVVITDGFSAREAIVHNKNGYVCKTKKQWITFLSKLVRNPSLRKKIGNNNYNKAIKEFSWKQIGKMQLSIFRSLFNKEITEWDQRRSKSVDKSNKNKSQNVH